MKRDVMPAPLLNPEQQYLADLELVKREEERIVEQGGEPDDFFIAMGQIARERLG
jgi:hypothetical protein